ncbi:MAG TPA: DNA gyrase inhibitor YacG, partial [Usitatibacter sp.]|nr:DNA gyrase inhibitor YacG [Usitatibacter sp.]
MSDSTPRIVACPACGELALFAPDNPWRPFCSERCRTRDLGAWASESYRIPAADPADPSDPA